MPNFAVLDGENVINIIVADSKAIAEEVTSKTCVEFDETDRADIGGTYSSGIFIPHKPYPSWVLNGDNVWEAPVSRPEEEGIYIWDEHTVSWVLK